MLAAQCVTACYTTTPLGTDARPMGGASVVVDITDRGRVELGSRLGPSPLRIEGRTLAATDSTLTLAVSSVEGLRGEITQWAGESVTLARSDLSLVQTRRLDKRRTTLLAAIVVGGVVAVLVTRSLIVSGSNPADGNTKPTDPGGNAQ